ncbi:MAG: hypothetical protein IPM56_15580 [Ignavibacteriales bacterium]|nr:MAG: hypothetical protein IPM56_15580 [Ignavibacteriales bacterium]
MLSKIFFPFTFIFLLLTQSNVFSQEDFQSDSSWIDFIDEVVQVDCYGGEFEVTGNYTFRNNKGNMVVAKVFYPFPVDEKYNYPHEIYLEEFDYKTLESGVSWAMAFDSSETKSFDIRYKQKTNDKSAKYILYTTQHWENPVLNAKFIISVPKKFLNVKISYPPSKTEEKDNRIFYSFVIKNLKTIKDIIITWN